MKKLKIRFATFSIAKYGGIVSQLDSKIKAYKELGHDVDMIMLKYEKKSNPKGYQKKLSEMESGEFQNKIERHSQNGGYEKSPVTGYFQNNYYGWLLPPSNVIPVFSDDALERWNDLVKDVDVIFWSFMPTKTSEAEGFNFWWKFFDLPSRIKQVFTVHDAYFDMRASWISALREKILFLDCCHLAGYNCCDNIGIPRNLIFNWREFPDKMREISYSDRPIDFFAAHIFKSMKRMDDLLRAIPHLNSKRNIDPFSVVIAGSGIEYSYMTSPTKTKEVYKARKKDDPDLPNGVEESGISLWDRALENDMQYAGMLGKTEVYEFMKSSKFAIDPSWATHYAQYCNTHINGFTIEAIINGCYPVYRDYRGLSDKIVEDPLFDALHAVIIPWDATPKQFAQKMKEAYGMGDRQFRAHTLENFDIAKGLFDSKTNAEETIKLLYSKEAQRELAVGEDSDLVDTQTTDVMNNFFGISLPIKWTTK